MGILLPKNLPQFWNTLLSPPPPVPRFRPYPTRTHGSPRFAPGRRVSNRKVATFCSIAAFSFPSSSRYGGWDDPGLDDDAKLSGNAETLHNLFVAMGIADGKYAVLFCFGFLSALAVSRVRIWTWAALPFSGLVFVSGLVVGVARAGVAGDLLALVWRNQESGGLSCEKMRAFGESLDDFGAKLSELECSLQRFVDLNHVESGEIKRYLDILNSLSVATVPVKKLVQDSTRSDFSSGPTGECSELEAKSNPKSSKKRREVGMVGADILQFFSAAFQEVLIGRASHKTKDNGVRRETIERLNSTDPNNQASLGAVHENTLANKVKLTSPMPVPTDNREDVKVDPLLKGPFEARPGISEMSSGTIKSNPAEMVNSGVSDTYTGNLVSSADLAENGNRSSYSRDESCDHDGLSDKEGIHVLNRDFRLMSMQGSYHKVVLQHKSHKTGTGRQKSHMRDYVGSGFNSRIQENEMISFSTEAEASLKSRKITEIYDKTYFPTNDKINGKVKSEREAQTIASREKATKLEAQTVLGDQRFARDDVGASDKSPSSSATTSVQEEFNHIVKHGVDLLRQAGECLKGQHDEKTAEILLYRSTRLLSAAVGMNPSNLLALGQLGNTCLLHGELKLKMSRDLRTLLSRNDPVLIGKRRYSQSGEQSNQLLNKEKLASVLVDVCEECEELLIEAGRNYKMVLSIEENDVRALYNWGLALSFRAQLIADIGPDAAFDADKMYLAAIEKFDAMLSRNKDYAPDGDQCAGGGIPSPKNKGKGNMEKR
uniref:E3 ubiquitin-protein ligase HACE1 n=1 Tax=Anthurium amnicola TaxID=1678845 RepID=A0A1D1YZ64_9ARAE